MGCLRKQQLLRPLAGGRDARLSAAARQPGGDAAHDIRCYRPTKHVPGHPWSGQAYDADVEGEHVNVDLVRDDRILVKGELVTVVAAEPASGGFQCVVRSEERGLFEVFLSAADVADHKVPVGDGSGDSALAIAAVWTQWMRWAIPRIRSAVLATRPLRPFAHQDDAVFGAMLPQPRLRFLLADEPGTGKTLMTGMYLAEGRRRGLVPGKTVIVVPALYRANTGPMACDLRLH
jgi:hypothetical protein